MCVFGFFSVGLAFVISLKARVKELIRITELSLRAMNGFREQFADYIFVFAVSMLTARVKLSLAF